VGESSSAEAEVEQIMVRIRAELAQRAPSWPALDEPSSSTLMVRQTVDTRSPTDSAKPAKDLPVPAPIRLALSEPDGIVPQSNFQPETGRRYHINELFDYYDRDFICAAYWAVFQRDPDDGGFNTYLALLRGGASKTAILEYLRDSPEGRLAKLTVAGLSFRIGILKIFRWPPLRSFGRIAAALWNLPEVHRRQRVVESKLFSLIEQNRARATEALRVVNRALRDLESADHNLTAYAASKLGDGAGRRLEASINSVADELRIFAMASTEDMRQAFNEVSASRESLRRALEAKANRPELELLASTLQYSLDVVSDELRKLKAGRGDFAEQIAGLRRDAMHAAARVAKSNTDMAGYIDMRRLLTHLSETKIDRPEFKALESITQNSLDEVGGELRKLKAERSDFAMQIAEMRGEALRLGTLIDQSNSDMASFNEIRQLLAHSLETKIDRPELKALASTTQNSLDDVGGELRKLAAERDELAKQIAELHCKGMDLSAHVEKSSSETLRLEEARQLLTESLDTKAGRPELDTLANHFLELVQARPTKEDIAEIKAGLEATLNRAVDLTSQLSQTKVDRLSMEVDKVETQKLLDDIRAQAKVELQGALAGVDARTRDVKLNLLDQERRLSLLLEEARKRMPEPISSNQIETMLAEEDHVLDAMYAEFEDIFRGTRADILKRQAIYIPFVREAGAGERSSPIVDLGCGRGEWLELLRGSGLRAQGVDLNRIFLERCRDLSLDVIESDAITFLRKAKHNSLGAVTSFHLIEHLPHKTLIAMLDAALHALRPGGIVILETPNPRNLQVASCNFYMDPTHRHPLPPDLMKFVVEARGFVSVEIKELHPYGAENLATEGPAKINDMLNRFLFSSQDYAVIGRKS
jgi:SAM-dependent methyltransferase